MAYLRLPDGTKASFSWDRIDTVFLDMDGTLLDKHFDDYFWEQYLPEHYSLRHNIGIEQARQELLQRYRQVEQTLDWTDLNYWSRQLDMDVANLKRRIDHLIAVHPYVFAFLEFCRHKHKDIHLITNAHSATLEIKLAKTGLTPWFDQIVCSQELGLAKEHPTFWKRLARRLTFVPERTLLADDTEKVLEAAAAHGIGHPVLVACPSSRKPSRYSRQFPAIHSFKDLLPATD